MVDVCHTEQGNKCPYVGFMMVDNLKGCSVLPFKGDRQVVADLNGSFDRIEPKL